MSLLSRGGYRAVQFEGACVLCDPGLGGDVDIGNLRGVLVAKPDFEVSCIVLSHPSASVVVGYFMLLSQHPELRDVPTFATPPVAKLGRIACLEALRSEGLLGNVMDCVYLNTDVEDVFNAISTANYSQTVYQSLLELTPLNAGHSLGGANWLIKYNNYKVMYAPIWNHSKDSFLNGFNVDANSKLARPTSLITAENFPKHQLSHIKQKDKFVDLLNIGLTNGSSFVLPTSLSVRFLELAFLILSTPSLDHVPIYLISFTGVDPLETADNFIQWMSKSITSIWESKNQSSRSLFARNRFRVVVNQQDLMAEVDANRTGIYMFDSATPNVFQNVISMLHSKLNFSVVVTEEPNPQNPELYGLYAKWKDQAGEAQGKLTILEEKVKWTFNTEVKLRQKEIAAHLKNVEDIKKEREDKLKEKLEEQMEEDQPLKEEPVSEEPAEAVVEKEEEEEPEDAKSLTIEEILRLPMDFDVSRLPMNERRFHVTKSKRRFDDYGEVVNHKDYIQEVVVEVAPVIPQAPAKKRQRQEPKKVIIDSPLDPIKSPVKLVPTTKKFTLRVGFTYLDLAGVHDQRALEYVEKKLKPYQTIYTNDSMDEVVELSNVITEYTVAIDQEDLKLQAVGNKKDGYQIGFIQGVISTKEDNMMHLVPSGSTSGYEIHIGDVKITSIYNKFKSQGFKVDLLGDGRLVVDGVVIVQKTVEGNIDVQGIDVQHTKKVRKEIMSQLAHISL